MKLIKGWRKISNQGVYLNVTTGQTLVVAKKEFCQTYHVSLYTGKQTVEGDRKRISPEFATAAKAEVYAVNLMEKNPNGIV
jgi:hypothetical protein